MVNQNGRCAGGEQVGGQTKQIDSKMYKLQRPIKQSAAG
jgi:hypothetical protein